jgi:hypothetical protein
MGLCHSWMLQCLGCINMQFCGTFGGLASAALTVSMSTLL